MSLSDLSSLLSIACGLGALILGAALLILVLRDLTFPRPTRKPEDRP